MQQPTILHIQMVPAGIELVIAALRKLPHEQVNDLVNELWTQYKQQMTQAAEVVQSAPVEPPTEVTFVNDSEGGSAD